MNKASKISLIDLIAIKKELHEKDFKVIIPEMDLYLEL